MINSQIYHTHTHHKLNKSVKMFTISQIHPPHTDTNFKAKTIDFDWSTANIESEKKRSSNQKLHVILQIDQKYQVHAFNIY